MRKHLLTRSDLINTVALALSLAGVTRTGRFGNPGDRAALRKKSNEGVREAVSEPEAATGSPLVKKAKGFTATIAFVDERRPGRFRF
ncbi:MAG TPA: hypothetical protein VEW46_14040 [Pyrinomonadaceae bacterium]|nr:hypothetical protein [Pyrinomonadaceae bacterium]